MKFLVRRLDQALRLWEDTCYMTLSWAKLGFPGWSCSGRRSFVPVIDGRWVTSQRELDKLGEDYNAYYDASYGAKLQKEEVERQAKFRRAETLPYPYQGA